jgi:hypothetical protein
MIRNRIIALYIQVDSFEEKYISSISNYVFQRGPRGYNPTKANLKKNKTGMCLWHARARWSFFFLKCPSSSFKKLKKLGFREVSWYNRDERGAQLQG